MGEWLSELGARAHPAEFWPILAALTLGAGLALRSGLRAFRQLRVIADTPTARLRSAPQGYVELSGQALAYPRPVAAVLTGEPCVWYRFLIEEQRGSGKNRKWVTVEQGAAPPAFLLDDGTGRCLIEPEGAEITCRAKRVWYGGNRRPSGPPERVLGLFSRRYRYTEERIREREPVYVLGHLETPRRGPSGEERLARGLLAAWKRDPQRMARLDTDGDGRVDLEEWEAARTEAARIAADAERRVQAEPPLSRVGRGSDPRHPFIVSTHGEGDLIRRLRLTTAGGTLLFLALASVLGVALTARLAA